MATVDVSCPNCEKTLKVPPSVFGKRVKCKYCEQPFVVRDPDEAVASAKPTKPGKPGKVSAKPAASPPPPPAPEKPKSPFLDDDDEADARKIEVVIDDLDPRCPHCAQLLDPPDAKVCLHCGFNNMTRERAEQKTVWQPDAQDWIMHLLPGIIALVICIALLVLNIIAFIQMREWLGGSFLESDDVDAAGRKKMHIHPGAFKFLILGISIPIFVPAVKLAYKRLILDYRPPEQIKK